MIAPHATPAAAHAALGEFITVDAPPLMAAEITVNYDYAALGPVVVTYMAKIHVTEDTFPQWLKRHGFTDADTRRDARSDGRDNLSVTSNTGVEIFCLSDRITDGGAE